MMNYLPAVAAALLLSPSPAAAAARIFCSIDEAPAVPCTMADKPLGGGAHVLTFTIGKTRVTFAGKSQTGWWAGKLNGKPAMGYELNRGHTRFSTSDLMTSFAWWYEGQEHGSY